jgi:hypothetical protein
MKFLKIFERLQLLAEELNKGHFGVANELATKIGIGRSRLFHFFNMLKLFGIHVRYPQDVNFHLVEEAYVFGSVYYGGKWTGIRLYLD